MSVVVIFIFFFPFSIAILSTRRSVVYGCCVFYPQPETATCMPNHFTTRISNGIYIFHFLFIFVSFSHVSFGSLLIVVHSTRNLRFFIWSIPSIRFGFAKHINNSPKTAHSTYGRTWTILLLMYMSVIICCQRRRRRFVIHVYNAMRHPADYVFL
jgi:hypothetical protein